MKVVKIGGSIERTHQLLLCLDRVIVRAHDNVIFVPGGGVFAEEIRSAQTRWRFDDSAAHAMAVLAMQQMGIMLNAIKPELVPVSSVEELSKMSQAKNYYVWMPDINELNAAGIPASWDITSDSLSAWLADKIQADELIIIKAADIPEHDCLSQLAELNIVDKAFMHFTQKANFKIRVVNQDHF